MRSRPEPALPRVPLLAARRIVSLPEPPSAEASKPPASTSSSPLPASSVRRSVKLLTLATSPRLPSETSTGKAWSKTPQITGEPDSQPAPADRRERYSKNAIRRSKPPPTVPCILSAFTSPGLAL